MWPGISIVCLIFICISKSVGGRYYGDDSSYNDTGNVSENDTDTSDDVLLREKRTLTFLDSTQLLLVLGFGTPLVLDRETVIIGGYTRILYEVPDNTTPYTEPELSSRSARSRWSIYKILETATELLGLGGKECMLRMICEVAHVPFHVNNGLFGEFVNIFLTPSSTNEDHDEYEDRDYHAAERLGRTVGENCPTLYPECQNSILDHISRINF